MSDQRSTPQVCAVIVDIIGSRRLEDRAEAQRTFLEVLRVAANGLDLIEVPRATVGDEYQALCTNLPDALTLTARTHLLLPPSLGLRLGLGLGQAAPVDAHATDVVQDGTAWWCAREAIDAAHALQDSGRDFARTQLRASSEGLPAADLEEAVVNAMLLLRDQAIHRLQPRQRRVVAGLLLGRTQADVALEERISQQAVSELARGAGAGILAAQDTLTNRGLSR